MNFALIVCSISHQMTLYQLPVENFDLLCFSRQISNLCNSMNLVVFDRIGFRLKNNPVVVVAMVVGVCVVVSSKKSLVNNLNLVESDRQKLNLSLVIPFPRSQSEMFLCCK
jgi:hypothetical protein